MTKEDCERHLTSSNRTFMELKFCRTSSSDMAAQGSNRTFMELKFPQSALSLYRLLF